MIPYIFNNSCSCRQWINWLSTLPATNNSTSATTSLVHGTLANPYLSPLLLILTCLLYLVLVILYQSSPGRGKLLFISTVVAVLSLFESGYGLLANAVISIIVFIACLGITTLLQSN